MSGWASSVLARATRICHPLESSPTGLSKSDRAKAEAPQDALQPLLAGMGLEEPCARAPLDGLGVAAHQPLGLFALRRVEGGLELGHLPLEGGEVLKGRLGLFAHGAARQPYARLGQVGDGGVALPDHLPGLRGEHPREDLQKRALAAAVGAGEGKAVAVAQRQADPVENALGAVGVGDLCQADGGHYSKNSTQVLAEELRITRSSPPLGTAYTSLTAEPSSL